MDWMSFITGMLGGAFIVVIAALYCGFKWMRPFIRQAQKAGSSKSMQPPLHWKQDDDKWGSDEGWKK